MSFLASKTLLILLVNFWNVWLMDSVFLELKIFSRSLRLRNLTNSFSWCTSSPLSIWSVTLCKYWSWILSNIYASFYFSTSTANDALILIIDSKMVYKFNSFFTSYSPLRNRRWCTIGSWPLYCQLQVNFLHNRDSFSLKENLMDCIWRYRFLDLSFFDRV